MAAAVYYLSAAVNDVVMQLVGLRLFLGPISYAAMLVGVFKGELGRVLKHRLGRVWLALALWGLVTVPFSSWPGASLSGYIDMAWRFSCFGFFIAAVTLTTDDLKKAIIGFSLGGTLVVVISCFLFGGLDAGGRFRIPDSSQYAGANDLAVVIGIQVMGLLYILGRGSMFMRLVSGVAAVMGLYYMLKTGSRGSFLAMAVVVLVLVLFTHIRKQLLIGTVLGIMCTVPMLSEETLSRLTRVSTDVQENMSNETDESAVADYSSQAQREFLLRKSIELTLQYPIFGVGIGQFSDMLWSTSKKKGQHVAALNTHNAYTQVSSEQGIPALVFYVTAIVTGLRISWRVYKKTRGNVGWADLNMLALSHFAALLFFAVNAFFHHSGGSMFLPCAVGLAIAIDYISQGLLTKDYQAALKAH